MKKSRFLTILTLLALTAALLGGVSLFSACSFSYRRVGDVWPGSFESNGERIYFTAESSSGEPIRYSGGVTMMMHGRNTCANCHGEDGKGRRVTMMMVSFRTPDITWDNLTEAEDGDKHQDSEEEHEEHPPYTEETLKIAITRGINPAGERLDEEMPRWRMSDSDLNDLVAFIKTLK